VMIFGAVGHIPDETQTIFIQSARDADCDYLVIDAQGWARLLIAYQKLCPIDGTIFTDKLCKHGHPEDEHKISNSRGVIVSPRVASLGSPGFGRFVPFTIRNITRLPYYNISVVINIDTPGLRPEHLALERPGAKMAEYQFNVGGEYILSAEISIIHLIDSEDRCSFQILIPTLPGNQERILTLRPRLPYGTPTAFARVQSCDQTQPNLFILNDEGIKKLWTEANHFLRKGNYQEALERAVLARKQAEEIFGASHQTIGVSEQLLGVIHFAMKKYVQAALYYQNAIDVVESAPGNQNATLSILFSHLANTCERLGKQVEAIDLRKKAISLMTQR